jgi:hypothetical protein
MGALAKSEDGILMVGGSVVAKTKLCCHCGNHFVMIKDSGKKRGWCMKCHSITCGALKCCKCVPFEKKLDDLEAGKITSL